MRRSEWGGDIADLPDELKARLASMVVDCADCGGLIVKSHAKMTRCPDCQAARNLRRTLANNKKWYRSIGYHEVVDGHKYRTRKDSAK